KILRIIGRSLKGQTGSINLSDQFYEKVLSCCLSEDDEKHDGVYVLECAIRHSNRLPSDALINKISSIIINNDSLFLGCQFFKAVVEKKCNIPEKALGCLVSEFNKRTIE